MNKYVKNVLNEVWTQSSNIPYTTYPIKEITLMNANKLLRAIRIYTGKSGKDFAKALGIVDSSVTYIESKQLNVSQYYGFYAKQANIPTWLIEFLIGEDDINTLQDNLKKVAKDILQCYEDLDRANGNPGVNLCQQEARKIITQMNKFLSQLEKLI